MASSFPGAIDNFTDPLANSSLASPSHAGQHSDLNDAVEKIETYMGLVKVIPTSVSSAGGTAATLSANGTVSIGSGNTSVTVNGAFSSLYTNYRVVVNVTSNTGGGTVLLQFGTATTEHYGTFYYDLSSGGDTGALRRSNQASFYICPNSIFQGRNTATFDVSNPFNTVVTSVTGTAYGNGYSCWFGGEQFSTTSFTSFTLTNNVNALGVGSIRVYGYRN